LALFARMSETRERFLAMRRRFYGVSLKSWCLVLPAAFGLGW
jgi:hypothetical protein